MRLTLFTANNPRHLALAERLAEVAETVHVVHEAVTVFPGMVDDFFRKTPVMQAYFERVVAAEREVFGRPRFLPANVRQLVMRTGDLSLAPLDLLEPALEADVFIVFGASYIRLPLVDRLIAGRAVNIHMGLSPWYRGSSCNFWALYDGRPELVGATIHRLSRGLDSGAMLFHVRPPVEAVDPFVFGMKAVRAAQDGLVQALKGGELLDLPTVPQDRSLEVRYTKNRDFNDAAAGAWLARGLTPDGLLAQLQTATPPHLIAPPAVPPGGL